MFLPNPFSRGGDSSAGVDSGQLASARKASNDDRPAVRKGQAEDQACWGVQGKHAGHRYPAAEDWPLLGTFSQGGWASPP